MNLSSASPVATARRALMAAVCVVLLVGWVGTGLHLLLHHADDPGHQDCVVCVQLAANPAAPAVPTGLPTDTTVAAAPTDPPWHAATPTVATSCPRAPPEASPVS